MTIKIDKKIVGYSVVKPDDVSPTPASDPNPAVQHMHESVARPDVLT
ncbi:MAG: NrdJb, partial [Candidatus Competibacter sp.]|nr:NrdJb [Candidatus Competibacter sp.]